METALLIACIVFAGGIVAVDSAPAFQFMVSRPIFCCTILGLILGNVSLGITFGALFELPYLVNMPLGGKHGAENGLGAVTALGLGLLFTEQNLNGENIIVITNFLYGMLIAKIGAIAVDFVRNKNLELVRRTEAAITKGEFSYINKAVFMGTAYSFLMGMALVFSSIIIGYVFLKPTVKFLHPDFDSAFGIAKFGVLGVGVGSVLSLLLTNKTAERIFLIALLIGLVISIIV